MSRSVLQVNVSEMGENKMEVIPMQSMKACDRVEVEFYSFLTSVLDGSV
jgi:hypothetical protein